MAIRINCPACKTPNNVDDDKRGRKVRCRKCEKPFSVPEASAKKKPAEEDAIQEGRKVKATTARKRDDDDEKEDGDDRPAKKKKEEAKGGFGMMLAVGGAAVLLLFCLLSAGGIGALFMFRTKAAEEQVAKAEEKKAEDQKGDDKKIEDKKADDKKDNLVDKKKDPIVDPDAGKPLPAQLTPELAAKVEQATVYLHVTMPTGVTAEGSGFFAMERGIIVTNAHVVGMLGATSRHPKQVEVVQDSGLPTETKMIGEVLGVDRASDLAIVRVPDNAKLPTPLTLASEAPTKLQKVYIFGFPFGEKLGKNITVSEQAVTSLRPGASGGLEQIQVNGGMNPGNSGGPVVNTQGNLIGVSVSIISGAQISFAVPAERVRKVMEGRISDHQQGEAYAQQGQTRIPVRLICLDPLNKIKGLGVEVWTGPPGAARPTGSQKPQPLPGDGPRQEHALKYANGVGTLDVPMPQLPAGHVYWVQPVLTSANGTHWSAAQPTAAEFAVLERKPANLTVNLEKHKERTAKVDSRFTTTESLGKKESKVIEHTIVELLEMVEPEVKDANKTAVVKTAVSQVTVRINVNGKNILFSRDENDALAISRGMPPTFVIDDTNATAGYRKVGMGAKHPKIYLKDLVELFNGMVNNPFEATQFKMPNRIVEPQEVFPSQSTMMMRIGGGAAPKGKGPQPATIYDLKMSCTFEGVRVRNGREEAVLTVAGTLETRKKVANKTLGDITGKIGFDIAGGFVSSAKIKIYAESEETIPGLGTLRDSISQDISLDRAAGNLTKVAIGGKDPPPGKDLPPNKEPVPGGGVGNPAPNEFFQGDVTLRHLTFTKNGKVIGDIVWAKDAKSFFMLYDNGLLQHISVASGHTEQFLEIGAPCTHLVGSAEGLLVCVSGRNEVWVISPEKLGDIRKKISVPGVKRVTAGAEASMAYAAPLEQGGANSVSVLDLKAGTVRKILKMPVRLITASPDGKFVFVQGGIEQLMRFRVQADDLVLEDATYRIASNGQNICFSPDSKYVCLPAGGGNGSNHKDHPPLKAYSTYIYPVDNLKRPVTGYAAGAYPRAVGIDPKSNCILAHNFGKSLIIYSFATDAKLAEYDFKPVKGGTTSEFSLSPLGSEAIARTEGGGIVHIKINKAGPPIKASLKQQPARDPIALVESRSRLLQNPAPDDYFPGDARFPTLAWTGPK